MNTYLISVKPKWANLFFDRATPKTVELRKGSFGKLLKAGDQLLIYSTLPVGQIIGEVRVRNRTQLPTDQLRSQTEEFAQVSPEDFESYYRSKDEGVAVWVDRPELFENPIALATLKNAGINPPQQLLKLTQKQVDALFPIEIKSTNPTEFDYLTRDIDVSAEIASSQIEALETDEDVFPKKEYAMRLLETQSRIAEWEKVREAIAIHKNSINGFDRLETDITQKLMIAQSESPDNPKSRLKRYVKIDILKYVTEAISRARIPFFVEYQEIIDRVHPQIEDAPNFSKEFKRDRVVSNEQLKLSVKIDKFQFCQDEWIAECRVINPGDAKCRRGDRFYIRAIELFAEFKKPCDKPTKFEWQSHYHLGTILNRQELKSRLKGVKIPKHINPFSTELTAPDGSIWQAVLHATNSHKSVKWMCEVLPDGLARSPRIPQTN